MVKKNKHSQNATAELVNFHFSTSPPSQQQQQQRSGNDNRNNNNGRNRNDQQQRQHHQQHNQQQQQRQKQYSYQRNKEDRASARKKASGKMFFLHSSPDHAFCISRRPHHHIYHHQVDQQQQQQAASSSSSYSFLGSDQPVSWEVVRSVKYFASDAQQNEACPICLDTFTCSRITKCGHVFCLSCLLHHVQSSALHHPYANGPKCPCCASLLHLQDLRPVEIISIIPPPSVVLHHQTTIRFTKLHRCTKSSCSAPFIPLPDYPRRSSPYAAPCQTDPDALFCRFNYVDMPVYCRLLKQNLAELQASPVYSDLDTICKVLAVETVQKEIHAAVQEQDEEQVFADRFQHATAGVYQAQPAHLLAANYTNQVESSTAAAAHARAPSSKDAVVLTNNKNDAAAAAEVTSHNIETASGEDAIFPLEQVDSKDTNDDDDNDEHKHGDDEKGILRAGDSTGTELSPPNSRTGRSRRRSRGDSITSHDTTSTGGGERQQLLPGGSMYLGEDESAFYQTDDGRLCFLSGFNMNCLCAEFTPHLPEDVSVLFEENISIYQRRKLSPLPDHVEGRVLEVEHVHLTSELRQRLRFLSHLPLYLDICFVEISLGNILSNKTKKAFSKEFNKRKQARLSKANAEKRADARVQKIEEERINERKATIQRIDPNDEFFFMPPDPIVNLTGDAFGPSISQQRPHDEATEGASGAAPPRSPVVSFAAVTRSVAFPSLSSLESAFPALGSSDTTVTRKAPTPAPWGRSLKSAPEHVAATSSAADDAPAALPQGGKKRKGKKVLLFSTGSHRGSL